MTCICAVLPRVLWQKCASTIQKVTEIEGGAKRLPAIGLGTACVYLFSLSALLVWHCMKVADMPSPTNEPLNLYQNDFTLQQIRQTELNNIQIRIQQATERNGATAYWLNRVRLLATSTPLVFGLAIFFSWVVTLF
jgi:hypothetical protein